MMSGIMGSISKRGIVSFCCERSHLGILVGFVGMM